MHLRRTLTTALLGASLVAAAPAVATAGPGHRGGDERRGSAQGYDRSELPSRIASRLGRAQRALDRATNAVDDGNATAAASALKGVRTNLTAAAKSAKRRASSDNGPHAFYAVAAGQHRAIGEIVSLYDGADDATVAALTETLNSAIDGRDDLVASIAALPADDQGSYEFVLDRIGDDVAGEIEAIDEALADDTLSADARAALTDARAKLVATQTTVQGLAATQANASAEPQHGSAAAGEDCPEGESGGRRGPRGGSNGTPTPEEAPQT